MLGTMALQMMGLVLCKGRWCNVWMVWLKFRSPVVASSGLRKHWNRFSKVVRHMTWQPHRIRWPPTSLSSFQCRRTFEVVLTLEKFCHTATVSFWRRKQSWWSSLQMRLRMHSWCSLIGIQSWDSTRRPIFHWWESWTRLATSTTPSIQSVRLGSSLSGRVHGQSWGW